MHSLVKLRAPDDWQPIETAPKDGSVFIAAWKCDGSGDIIVSGDVHWWRPRRQFLSVADGLIYPTHWQPLPAPPAST